MLTLTEPSIRKAAAHEEAAAVNLIVQAFFADPAVRWLYPRDEDYAAYFGKFVRAFAGRSFASETAYLAEDGTGAALWIPPGTGPDEDALGAVVERTIPEERLAEVFRVMEQMGAAHPEVPHWYLPMIGVDAGHRRRGIGSALLQGVLRKCDARGLAAYLESTNPANQPFYERHGFRAVGEIVVGDCPPIVPMVREAR